ncbi:Speckle-type POZ protein B [Araneus ventricosus]|uniref:Speckle-type POZ protein B n=1 Tax=Araneus ventricosus TaxID=182803 RepID=A0A4Y2HP49_ARAVE|nr:Speckle-type POZ protein B [Araneus ventricosus]
MDEINLRKKAEYLPNDTLSVCCKMWKGEGDRQNAEQISARTRIAIEKISVLHIVESFSTLQPNVKKTKKIQSHLFEELVYIFSLYYTDSSCGEEKIIIEIVPPSAKKILHKCKLSLLGSCGIIRDCGEIDYAFDAERISIHKLPLSLTREEVLNRKSEYLPKDNFCLLCECTFSTEMILNTIEEHRHELPFAAIKQKSNHDDNKDLYKAAEKISECCSVSEDIKAIYIKQQLTDMELRAKTKSFPAHKVVMCVRSPVFEAMLTSEMTEKIKDCIQVNDLENDIVEQLLLFLYSDNLERLQWESATQLYYAAKKYQIGKLKAMCSSFLAENLCISNASELLNLSDTHNDSNLMKVVEDFILKHEKQIYNSNGWEKLKETNPQLVIKTMCLKYKRGNEVN